MHYPIFSVVHLVIYNIGPKIYYSGLIQRSKVLWLEISDRKFLFFKKSKLKNASRTCNLCLCIYMTSRSSRLKPISSIRFCSLPMILFGANNNLAYFALSSRSLCSPTSPKLVSEECQRFYCLFGYYFWIQIFSHLGHPALLDYSR